MPKKQNLAAIGAAAAIFDAAAEATCATLWPIKATFSFISASRYCKANFIPSFLMAFASFSAPAAFAITAGKALKDDASPFTARIPPPTV